MKRRNFAKNLCLGLAPLLPNSSHKIFSQSFMDMKKARKPLRLKKGATIGLIAPSSPIQPNKYEKSIRNLKNLGFKLVFGKSVKKADGYLAGSDKERLDDLHAMFENPEIDGIWCIRGGYGSARFIPDIDFDLIKRNPKVFIGYSDITALLIAIHQQTGLICFHGPVAASEFSSYTQQQVQAVLMQPQSTYTIAQNKENEENNDSLFQDFVIRPGIASGKLTGGNLSLICSLIGTPWQMKIKNRLLFIEDIGESPYRIDRMLTQLNQHYDLNKAAGIILGVFLGCERKDEGSWTLRQTLTDRFKHLSVPIMYGLSVGHIDNMCTLPLGIEAELNTQQKTITLLQKAVL